VELQQASLRRTKAEKALGTTGRTKKSEHKQKKPRPGHNCEEGSQQPGQIPIGKQSPRRTKSHSSFAHNQRHRHAIDLASASMQEESVSFLITGKNWYPNMERS
jgi:hypothetical protein